jgi:lysyl-tRNA synthetase class 2
MRRAAILRRLRGYFDSTSVLEVDTPALSTAAISDVQIESLTVHSKLVKDALYLHTSPEFSMKRMLASGYPDIYSIARVFRDGELGRYHQPEFTLVEWYRLGFSLDDIITDTLRAIAAALNSEHLADEVEIVDYRSAFLDACGIDPIRASIETLIETADADDDLRQALGDERNDWLDLILSSKVAPGFRDDRLTCLRHYPAAQAALARICPGDPDVADRFEIFMGMTEIANGYVELTDHAIQARRIAADQASRARRGLLQRPIDQSLLDALNSGLPACAGVAMGLERLQMKHDKTDDIRDVIAFAFEY